MSWKIADQRVLAFFHQEFATLMNSPFGHRFTLARLVVLILLAMAAASAYLTRHCLAVANTTMQTELGINNQQFGYLYSAFSIGYLICQVPGGWLGQRIGTRTALPLLSLLWSVMTLVTARASTVTSLVIARFVFGLGQAGLVPNQAKVMNDWFPAATRGTASAAIVVAMSVGGVASLGLTSWMMRFYDWRTVFHLYSLVGVVWAALFYYWFRTYPSQMHWLRSSGTPPVASADAVAEAAAVETDSRPLRNVVGRMIIHASVWCLVGQALFKAAGYNLIITFFPAMLEYQYDVSRSTAGSLASWSLVGVILGSAIGGPLIDVLQRQTGNKRISRCAVSGIALALTALCMCTCTRAETAWQLSAGMMVAAALAGVSNPCPWAVTVDLGGPSAAIVMGMMNSGACLAGVLITPMIGRLMDHLRQTDGNWDWILLVHAGCYLAAAALWLVIHPDTRLDTTDDNDAD